jgi:hypothetical protein
MLLENAKGWCLTFCLIDNLRTRMVEVTRCQGRKGFGREYKDKCLVPMPKFEDLKTTSNVNKQM